MHPRTLGRYEIERELGRGGMGRVYLAHDPEIDRAVAIKVVEFDSLTAGRESEARREILAEARAAGRLLHPAIVALFDVGETDDGLYLAMEFVEGTTLDRYCRGGDLLPVPTIVDMIAAVADALDYAHDAGVVHRDVKPANVMRVGDTAVKVMDFGLARPAEQQRSLGGSLFGTPSYMSPEQIRGDAVDGRSDLFSLTVVLFELLSGERPFQGASVASVVYRVVHEPPRPLEGLDGRIPAALRKFVEKGLSKDRDERHATGSEFAAALRETVDLDSIPPEPVETSAQAPPAPTDVPTPATATPSIDSPLTAKGDPSPQRPAPPAPAARKSRPPKRQKSSTPFVLGLITLVAVVGSALWTMRDKIGFDLGGDPPEIWWEAVVRTEPSGVEVLLDGVALDPESAGVVRFQPEGPFGELSATRGCREARHRIEPTDASGEIVLVIDPAELSWRLDPGVPGAEVRLNGEGAGTAPADLTLDLCRENRIEVDFAGYRPAAVELPAGISPLDARTALAGMTLDRIPTATLRLPALREMKLIYYVDGDRLGEGARDLELTEGRHEIRYKNDFFWIDETRSVELRGGTTIDAPIELPPLTTLVVQAYPSNCKVFVRRPGGRFRYVDDTPMRRRVAPGEYDVRVVLNPTGEERVERVRLEAGENPPLRVSFRSDS